MLCPSCIVVLRSRRQWCWHHHWHCCLCTSLLATCFNIQTIYLVGTHVCIYVSHYAHQIFSDSDIVFKWQQFWYFSLICYPVHLDSYRDFILHILMYIFFTYIHKKNNATVTYFLKFMSTYSLLLI